MAAILISPWHLARQHSFAVARLVKKAGIRNVARKAKVNRMMVSRFCVNPSAQKLSDFYRIADAVGVRYREISPAAAVTRSEK